MSRNVGIYKSGYHGLQVLLERYVLVVTMLLEGKATLSARPEVFVARKPVLGKVDLQ